MKKINLVELLKDCIGMELDCAIFDDVTLYRIDTSPENEYPIRIETKSGNFLDLTKYGTYSNIEESKCVIFPKGKTTWEGFVPPCKPCKFKDGDVIVDKYGAIALYKRVYDSHKESLVDFHCGLTSKTRCFFVKDKDSLQHCGEISSIRFATEEEKAELFDTIKAKGYKWNEETKTLEKLVESKVKDGDIVTYKYENGLVSMIFSKSVNFVEVHYHCALYDNAKGFITNNYIVGEPKYIRLADEEEKGKLFDAIKANGYKWNPKTKTLETLVEFKDGDVIANDRYIAIFHKFKEGYMYYHCWYNNDSNNSKFKIDFGIGYIYEYRLASEKEKQKLFQAIKDNGYRWNEETKTLEKLVEPEFKDGDIVTLEDKGLLVACIYKERKNAASFNHHIALYEGGLGILVNGEIVLTVGKLRFATEEEKQKLFDTIKENGYRWNSETKTLGKLPKFKVGDRIILKDNPHNIPSIRIKAVTKSQYILENEGFFYIDSADEKYVLEDKFNINTLVPFESRVLVRSECDNLWRPAIFGFYLDNNYAPYYAVGGTCWEQCIPYEGNEHLRGKIDNCDKFYRTWEKTGD